MAAEVRQFNVLIPHGTTAANPLVTDCSFPVREVSGIRVRVPPGPRGEVGFKLGSGSVPIIPDNQGNWIITDDDTLQFDLTDQHNSGSWDLIAYNTGTYDHTLYITFLLDLVDAPGSNAIPTVPDMTGTVVPQ